MIYVSPVRMIQPVRFRFPRKLAFPSSPGVSWQRCNVLRAFRLVITLINNEHTGIYPTHAPASPGQITFLNKPRCRVPTLPTYSPTYPRHQHPPRRDRRDIELACQICSFTSETVLVSRVLRRPYSQERVAEKSTRNTSII